MSAISDLASLRAGAGPVGPGQSLQANPVGVDNNSGGPSLADGLASLFAGINQRGDDSKLGHHLRKIQQLYPKLLMADHANGEAQMVGPAADQFLAAAYARHHGAKTAHVRNNGRGQRLHLSWD